MFPWAVYLFQQDNLTCSSIESVHTSLNLLEKGWRGLGSGKSRNSLKNCSVLKSLSSRDSVCNKTPKKKRKGSYFLKRVQTGCKEQSLFVSDSARAPERNTRICSELTVVWISDLCTAGISPSIFMIKLRVLSAASWNSGLLMTSMSFNGAGSTDLPKVLRARYRPKEDRTEGLRGLAFHWVIKLQHDHLSQPREK